MKNVYKKILSIFIIFCLLILTTNVCLCHSGRTDSSGGHRDNQNKSGLGSYHYHCGGHPAHLHDNGVCPYSTASVVREVAEPEPVDNNIYAESIKINENIESMEVGEQQKLTATITPNNVTDNSINWKSSDESVATITNDGTIVAMEVGKVTITVTTSNGKEDSITIEVEKIEEPVLTTSSTNISTVEDSDNNENDSEDASFASGLLTIGLLGGGSYWIYNKFKK